MTSRLAALVRKELIRPETPLFPGEDGFRFRHILIRDAAYDALPKATRAGLHERFASWLEEHGTELVELDELLGYHLESRLSLPRRARDARRRRPGRRGATAPGGRRPACGPPAGLRRRREPARARSHARASGRARPRPRDRARGGPVLDGQGRRRAPASRCSGRAGRCDGRSCRRDLREDHGGCVPAQPPAAGSDGGAGRIHPGGLARARGRRRPPGAVHRLLRARRGGVGTRTDGRGAGSHRTGLRARSAGRPADRGYRVPRRVSLLRVDPRARIFSSGSTRTNRKRRGTSSSVPTAP